MDLKDYKQIISKIDKKLKNKLDEEEITKLKNTREKISNIIYPQNEDQEIEKKELDENEKEKLYEEYNNIRELIKYKRKDFSNDMNIDDYKKVISKIDKKLKEDEKLDEEVIKRLKNARRTIYIIISPPSRFTY
jgi:hypothetical protein